MSDDNKEQLIEEIIKLSDELDKIENKPESDKYIHQIVIPCIIKNISQRTKDFISFTARVIEHIENYTVSQYGDKGQDICTEYSIEECLRQAEKYIKRYGKNAREGQQELDFLKAAHFIQMGYEKYMSQQENK